MKHACMSNVKDPENRSRKKCVCGMHSSRAKKPRGKKHRAPKPTEILAEQAAQEGGGE